MPLHTTSRQLLSLLFFIVYLSLSEAITFDKATSGWVGSSSTSLPALRHQGLFGFPARTVQ
jgi:hypothetical protein